MMNRAEVLENARKNMTVDLAKALISGSYLRQKDVVSLGGNVLFLIISGIVVKHPCGVKLARDDSVREAILIRSKE